MYHIATLPETDRRVLFLNTAQKKALHPAIVEKDFWVCLTINYLFSHSQWKDAFIFKGGTSLSKAYHLIERFSEDIDLILDWRFINYCDEPWQIRSKTQQDKINKQMNNEGAIFTKEKLLPIMQKDLSDILSLQTTNKSYEEAIFSIIYRASTFQKLMTNIRKLNAEFAKTEDGKIGNFWNIVFYSNILN